MDVLIDPDRLLRRLDDPALVLLDVRWALGRTDGHEEYLAGHLPGAVYVDLDQELAGTPSPAAGRHPLPDAAVLQAAARRWGVRAGSHVVVYDDWGSMAAARAWWLLRWAGLSRVQILDGALGAWREAGHPLATGESTASPGDVVLTTGQLPVVNADQVAALAGHGTGGALVLDARAGERFRGEVEPIDPRPGHIPGSVSAPTTDTLGPDGAFLPAGELRRRFAELGIAPDVEVAVYCGSGVTAAHEIAALTIAGFEAALYAGSWSQWCQDPERPAALGGPSRQRRTG